MSARRSRLMDGMFREHLHERRMPLGGGSPPPPPSSSSVSPSDLRQAFAAAVSPPPSSQLTDVKPLPSVLLPQGDRRIASTDRRYLMPETQPPPPTLAFNGSGAAMMTAAAIIKSDEPPTRPSSSGWPGGAGGGCTSASESTRASDDDLDDDAGLPTMELLVGGPTDTRTPGSGSAAASFAAAAPAVGGRHVCTICGTTFTMLGNLNRHKKSHMNVRPYNCNFCTRGFLRRTSYVEHVRLHTGEKPYLCLACGQSFVRKKCFQTHAKCCPGGGSGSMVADAVASTTGGVGPAAGSTSSGSCNVSSHGLAGPCNGSCESDYAATNVTSAAIDHANSSSSRCDPIAPDALASTAASDRRSQRAFRSSVSLAAVCDRQPDAADVGRSQAAIIVHPGIAYGSRFLGTKPLVRHQAGIGRTSFSIMKRARSTQLSRWKKQHLMGLNRPSSHSASLLQTSVSSSPSLPPSAGTPSGNRGNGSLVHRFINVGRRGTAHLFPLCSSDKRRTEQSKKLLPPEGLSSMPLLPPPADSFSKSTLGSGGSAAAAQSPSRSGAALPSSVGSGCYPAANLSEQSPCSGDASIPTTTASHRPVSPISFVAPAAGAVGVGPPGLVSSPPAVATNVTLPLRSPSTATGCSPTTTGGTAAAATTAAGVSGIMESSAAPLPRDVKLFHCRHCDIYFANLVTFLLHRGLHGEGDPLKCSICGKQCRDANEFLIHH